MTLEIDRCRQSTISDENKFLFNQKFPNFSKFDHSDTQTVVLDENGSLTFRALVSKDFEFFENKCPICAGEMQYLCISKCSDRICWQCCLRWRLLRKSAACPLCRTVSPKIILNDKNVSYLYLDLTEMCSDTEETCPSILYSDDTIKEACHTLQKFACWHEECRSEMSCSNNTTILQSKHTFQEFAALQRHLETVHSSKYCTICYARYKKSKFLVEMKMYDSNDIKRHYKLGEQELRIENHPKCRLCKFRAFDWDEYVRHSQTQHFLCENCVSKKRHTLEVFSDLNSLLGHLLENHGINAFTNDNVQREEHQRSIRELEITSSKGKEGTTAKYAVSLSSMTTDVKQFREFLQFVAPINYAFYLSVPNRHPMFRSLQQYVLSLRQIREHSTDQYNEQKSVWNCLVYEGLRHVLGKKLYRTMRYLSCQWREGEMESRKFIRETIQLLEMSESKQMLKLKNIEPPEWQLWRCTLSKQISPSAELLCLLMLSMPSTAMSYLMSVTLMRHLGDLDEPSNGQSVQKLAVNNAESLEEFLTRLPFPPDID